LALSRGIQRHVAWDDSTLKEPPSLPSAALRTRRRYLFSRLVAPTRSQGADSTGATAIPELSGYSKLRRIVAQGGVLTLTAASPSDAVLQ